MSKTNNKTMCFDVLLTLRILKYWLSFIIKVSREIDCDMSSAV